MAASVLGVEDMKSSRAATMGRKRAAASSGRAAHTRSVSPKVVAKQSGAAQVPAVAPRGVTTRSTLEGCLVPSKAVKRKQSPSSLDPIPAQLRASRRQKVHPWLS